MKRILWPLLLILLLCGCTEPVPAETTMATMPPATTETIREPEGIYVPFSDLEIQTGGNVRYFLPEQYCYGIRMMGDDVLAFSGVDKTTLTRYTGEQMYPVASRKLDCWIDPQDTAFQISVNGITYYNGDTREVIFLDNDLKEVRRLGISGELVGKPVLSANRMQLFYCTAEAIRVYDLASNLDKLLKNISYHQQSVESVLLNDTILRCTLTDDRGEKQSIFLSTQTGELLEQIPWGVEVSTYGDAYYAKVPEGIQELLVFGSQAEEARTLIPADPFARSWFIEETHGVVTATLGEDTTELGYYDLDSGTRKAAIALPGGMEVNSAEIQKSTSCVVVLAYDPMKEGPVILLWDKESMPALLDDSIYTGPRYTAGNPDVAGLDACAARARELGEMYGVQVLIGQDAVDHEPWDYTLEQEYQPAVIWKQLASLETVLAQFPEGMLRQLSYQVSICVVRSIQGNAESGSLAQAQGLQFWDGNQPYVALAAGDTFSGAFYHEIFHVLDGKILSDTRVYYRWNNMNPEGFQYFEDYTSYQEVDADHYLRDEDRVFIDAYSMSYAREDRARIMEYACQPGNGRYFQSEVMQNKLKTLCQGIRQTFGLEKSPETFLWEQYLREPLNS